MKYEIDNSPIPLNWEAKGEERILQNARNILQLRRGEVPYAGGLGMDAGIDDLPASKVAQEGLALLKETFAVDFGGVLEGGAVRVGEQGLEIQVRLEV